MKKKILIVDDSKGWLEYHASAFKQIFGDEFELELADSARKAYDMVYNNLKVPYALILTDMQMECDFEPKYAGEWFVEQVKKLSEYRAVPVVIVSAAYNIQNISERLSVSCLAKAVAARDLTSYELKIKEILSL